MEGGYQGDPMVALAGALMAVGDSAKDLHYAARGGKFYGLHLMADRIAEPVGGFCDRIKELGFAGSDVPPSKDFVAAEDAALGGGASGNGEALSALSEALSGAERALGAARSDGGSGMNGLFDEIAEHLLTSMFLVNRSLREDGDGEGEGGGGEGPGGGGGGEGGGDEPVPGAEPAGPGEPEGGGEGGGEGGEGGEGDAPGVGALKGMLGGGHA